MITKMAWIPGHGTYSLDTINEPYNPEAGSVNFTKAQPKDETADAGFTIDPLDEAREHPLLQNYLDVASFANLATIQKRTEENTWQAQGDPTEIAIKVFSARFGKTGLADHEGWNQLTEFPFDSSIKKMSVLFQSKSSGETHIFTKGAVERVISSCSNVSSVKNSPSDLAEADVLANMESLARRGLRVLALASKPIRSITEQEASQGLLKREEFESDLLFRGLVGIYDPPRPESRPSVFKCHQAGIGVHMLTGDHPETARAIAGEVGILPSRMELLREDIARGMVMAAHDFDHLTDDQIDQLPQLPLVVARCAPNTKVRMIDALHRRGRYVAMTGDGVNDSPSLKRADVGIAMGLAGSDVAKR